MLEGSRGWATGPCMTGRRSGDCSVEGRVGRRRDDFGHSLGIRMALGEPRGLILRRVLRDATLSCAIGVAVGLAVAAPLADFLTRLLVDLHPNDVIIFCVVVVLFMAVAVCVAGVPAHRAGRVDPMTTLGAG